MPCQHDPALEAHEHAEHAEHAAHARDPFISKVSITVAVLAVLAATAGSLETVEGGRAITESSDAVLAQDKATDAWNEYQADSLKRHMYDIAAEKRPRPITTTTARPNAAAQDKARAKAEEAEKERDVRTAESARHEARHHWLTGAATLIEIGIALSTVAIITRRQTFWFAPMGLGATGVVAFRGRLSWAESRNAQSAGPAGPAVPLILIGAQSWRAFVSRVFASVPRPVAGFGGGVRLGHQFRGHPAGLERAAAAALRFPALHLRAGADGVLSAQAESAARPIWRSMALPSGWANSDFCSSP